MSNKSTPTPPNSLHPYSSKSEGWSDRIKSLHDEFVFGDYRWTYEKIVNHSSTIEVVYKVVPLHKSYIQVNILSVFKSKLSNYRQHFEAQMSWFFDYTVMNIEVSLVESDLFYVHLTCVMGSDLFNKIRAVYTRPGGPGAAPILTANHDFEGTAFPVKSVMQYSNAKTFDKGYLHSLFGFDPEGELISDHYDDTSFDHGVPIISLMLTPKEYKHFIHKTTVFEEYRMITDLEELIDTLGSGDHNLGKIILWIGYLVDNIGILEYWTFSQAHDEDPCVITTIRSFNVYEDDNNEIYISAESTVSGIMSEGVEALIIQDKNRTDTNELSFNISFCNGIENEITHAKNLKRMTGIVFDNLYNDLNSFGWKLGASEGSKYYGLLCVADDIRYTESRDSRYVRNAKVTVKYHPYYFFPHKKIIRMFKFHKKCSDVFGSGFSTSQLMYPVKSNNCVTVYKSYGKNSSKKFNYVALVSIKDYHLGINGLLDTIRDIAESCKEYRINLLKTEIFENPIDDAFCYDLIDDFVKPYINLHDDKTCAIRVGKRMLVLEKNPFEA